MLGITTGKDELKAGVDFGKVVEKVPKSIGTAKAKKSIHLKRPKKPITRAPSYWLCLYIYAILLVQWNHSMKKINSDEISEDLGRT